MNNVVKYKIEIAEGVQNNTDTFKRGIISTFEYEKSRGVGEVPKWGIQYSWRIVYSLKDGTTTYSDIYHFSILKPPVVDTAVCRLRVIQKAKKYKDAYVFLDATRTLYDMDGRPVWYLPKMDVRNEAMGPRDIKVTPQGTITFVLNTSIFEISYDGEVLWKGPDNPVRGKPNVNEYHHEFTRLTNGHYMVLGTERVFCKSSGVNDSNFHFVTDDASAHENDTTYRMLPFSTILEYDEQGKVVWSWRSANYLVGSDLFYWATANGRLNANLHQNAFYFDERSHELYTSFRNIDRVIKIKYPEGTVLTTYGSLHDGGANEVTNNIFCSQHCCRRSHDGLLYVYNNNDCHQGVSPTIFMMEDPDKPGDLPKKVWEYVCAKNEPVATQNTTLYGGGGNVIELPDNSLFVCMGHRYNKLFIVDRKKEITWTAVAEKWDATLNKWDKITSYRGSMILSKKDLEHLVWHERVEGYQ
jgi:hypothetical protein